MTDRVALVTGAGQGVGLGIATVLANEGAAVAVNDLHPERAEAVARSIVEAGGKAVGVAFDVTDRPRVEDGIAAVTEQLGPIDILVNNAGIAEQMAIGPFLQSDPATWRPTFDLNLFGSMECIHAVAPAMVDRGWGRVIQISSGASSTGLSIGVSLYGAAKAGIEGLFRHLAVELGPAGVTCNVLALGLMENGVRTDQPGDPCQRGLPQREMIGRGGSFWPPPPLIRPTSPRTPPWRRSACRSRPRRIRIRA
jgi:NAD(P)-dependent dehydrogenase (short-subunit alcohol dehydrogenase family)